LSVAFSGMYYGQDSTTIAGVQASDTQGANVTGGGAVNIFAHTGGTQVGASGSLIMGDGAGSVGGFSGTVMNLSPTTAAFIGADPTVDPRDTPTAASTLNVGDVSLNAITGDATLPDGTNVKGTIIDISVAGASSGGKIAQSPDDPTKSLPLPANFG